MCLVCAEWNKGRLTKDEALRNLKELRLDEDLADFEKRHLWEVEQKVKLDDHKRWLEERNHKLTGGFDEPDQS